MNKNNNITKKEQLLLESHRITNNLDRLLADVMNIQNEALDIYNEYPDKKALETILANSVKDIDAIKALMKDNQKIIDELNNEV